MLFLVGEKHYIKVILIKGRTKSHSYIKNVPGMSIRHVRRLAAVGIPPRRALGEFMTLILFTLNTKAKI
jgi:hypothetical protein